MAWLVRHTHLLAGKIEGELVNVNDPCGMRLRNHKLSTAHTNPIMVKLTSTSTVRAPKYSGSNGSDASDDAPSSREQNQLRYFANSTIG
jgi:hypothetical protein